MEENFLWYSFPPPEQRLLEPTHKFTLTVHRDTSRTKYTDSFRQASTRRGGMNTMPHCRSSSERHCPSQKSQSYK